MTTFARLLILLLLLAAPGCVQLELRDGAGTISRLRPLGTVADAAPLAWSPDGESLATVARGLVVFSMPEARAQRWSEDSPAALAWGEQGLVAAYNRAGTARIVLYSSAGEERQRFALAGLVGDLLWLPQGELLATVSRVTVYRFGANLQTALLRWRPAAEPVEVPLGDTTLKPGTAQALGERIPAGAKLALSPYGDELLYSQLLDPPAFDPYLRLTLRHLASGVERIVGRGTLASGGGVLLADGESLAYGDGDRSVWRTATWGEGNDPDVALHPLPGRTLVAGGGRLLVDGHLFQEQTLLFRIPDDARAAFSPDDRSLALVHRGRLYLVALPAPPTPPPAPGPRLLQLRSLRAQGLISLPEYRHFREKESAHVAP